jgi:methylated-DNA-protein-cysteine methyltransferase-like protein
MKKKTESSYDLIWQTVKRIPRGKVSTYGDISRIAGLGENARLVGYALHNIPHGADIPWHRVINAQGKISLPHIGGAYSLQKKLLNAEKIVLVNGKIDLKKFGWKK